MSKYEALTRMGVQHPGEILRYELYSIGQTDILRIIYNRKKGSILPVTKKYRFPQIKKSTMVDSGTRKTQVLFESSNELRNAIAELDKLLDATKHTVSEKQVLMEELRLMEEEFAVRISTIRRLLEKE